MRTFLEYYRRSIQPQIEMIDIFLKTEQPPYDKAAVAEVLGLSAEALTARMQKEHLAYITKGIFFRLLAEGENSLGGMLKRAVACGLPRAKAREYAAQMLLGSARLALDTQTHPEVLKDAVCSPGGSTIAGVRALESSAFRSAAMEAVLAAYEKTKALG